MPDFLHFFFYFSKIENKLTKLHLVFPSKLSVVNIKTVGIFKILMGNRQPEVVRLHFEVF